MVEPQPSKLMMRARFPLPAHIAILKMWLVFPIIVSVGRKKNRKRNKKAKALKESAAMGKQSSSEQESLSALTAKAEPWEKWESKLVIYSIVLAIVGLVILGTLINWFIL